MTVAPPESSQDAEPFDDAEPVVRPVVRQRAHQRRRRKRLVIIQAGVTLLCAVALVALAWFGWTTALRITGGSVDEVTDPAAPGYVAAVKPTSVTLVALAGAPVAGEAPSLAAMLLVIGRSDGDRTLVPVPADTTLWEFEDSVPQSAADVFVSGGIDVLRLRMGADLGFGATAALQAPVSLLDRLVGAVGPLTIDLPDNVLDTTSDADATVRYPAGELTLEPGEVADFVAFAGRDESGVNRALRQELVWEALVGALESSGGRPLADLELDGEAAGEGVEQVVDLFDPTSERSSRVETLPMLALPLFVSPPKTIYRIDPAAMPEWTAGEVPFPVSAFPGQRARVELLNGTTDQSILQQVSPRIVAANSEIALTGNAESFDVTRSRVEYATPQAGSAAEQVAAELGLVATQVSSAGVAAADVVVVVGSDLVRQ